MDDLLLEMVNAVDACETGVDYEYNPTFTDGKNTAVIFNQNCITFNGKTIVCDDAYIEIYSRFKWN